MQSSGVACIFYSYQKQNSFRRIIIPRWVRMGCVMATANSSCRTDFFNNCIHFIRKTYKLAFLYHITIHCMKQPGQNCQAWPTPTDFSNNKVVNRLMHKEKKIKTLFLLSCYGNIYYSFTDKQFIKMAAGLFPSCINSF